MKIYIPSTGRANNLVTLQSIPKSWWQATNVVVYPSEFDAYHRVVKEFPGMQVLSCPVERSIVNKRQWIIERTPRFKLVMLDDDLTFATRRRDAPTKFVPSTERDMEDMLAAISSALTDYVHVSVCPREGGNRKTAQFDYNTRINRVLGYQAAVFEEHGLKYNVPFMEDFYINLSLLTRGYDSCTLNDWVQDQKGSNTAGGLSGVRDKEGQAAAARALHAKFPEFVTVVQRETKGAWGGGVRTDVRVQWKKARASYDANT